MRRVAWLLLGLLSCLARATELDLAATTCAGYETKVLKPDAIEGMMWLFGYAVGASGERVMYGDALTPFGFALDAECKDHPRSRLLDALKAVKPKRDHPMDLTGVKCSTFETRHREFARTDADSANTTLMWLFGFSTARSGSHLFDSSGLARFDGDLATQCAKTPDASLYDVLVAVNPPRVLKKKPSP